MSSEVEDFEKVENIQRGWQPFPKLRKREKGW